MKLLVVCCEHQPSKDLTSFLEQNAKEKFDIVVYYPEYDLPRSSYKRRLELNGERNSSRTAHQALLRKHNYTYKIVSSRLELSRYIKGKSYTEIAYSDSPALVRFFATHDFAVERKGFVDFMKKHKFPPIPATHNKDLPNVLMTSKFFGIRELKLAKALQRHVNVFALGPLSPGSYYGIECFINPYFGRKEYSSEILKDILQEWKIDVILAADIHPLTNQLLDKGIPLILDIQDVPTMIEEGPAAPKPETVVLEKRIVESCSFLISVSSTMTNYLRKKYTIKAPVITLPCLSSIWLTPSQYLPKLSSMDNEKHVVYQGSIVGDKGPTHAKYMMDVFQKMVENKIHVHLYAKTKNDLSVYDSLDSNYFHKHNPVSPTALSVELTKYDYSLCIFNNIPGKKSEVLQCGLPNKLYDSLISQVPVLTTSDTPLIAEVIKEQKCGLSASTIDELVSLINKRRIPKVTKRVAESSCFEYNIDELLNYIKENKK